MIGISKLFPDVIFTLEGIGEDDYDFWRTRFVAGYHCTIRPEMVWPDFPDLSKWETG